MDHIVQAFKKPNYAAHRDIWDTCRDKNRFGQFKEICDCCGYAQDVYPSFE